MYKGGCSMRGHTCIEVFKEELTWAIDKWLQVIVIKCSFKQLYHQESRFKLDIVCIAIYVALSNIS